MAIRILLADDNPDYLHALRAVVETHRDMYVVAEAENGLQAVRLAAQVQPDVAVLDVRMPLMNGIEATQLLIQERTCSAVILVSVFVERSYAVAAARAGASGYLSKTTDGDYLAQAIRLAARGGSSFVALASCAAL